MLSSKAQYIAWTLSLDGVAILIAALLLFFTGCTSRPTEPGPEEPPAVCDSIPACRDGLGAPIARRAP